MIKVRAAAVTDAGDLAEIEATQPCSARWGEAGLLAEIANKFSCVLVACMSEGVVGFICFRGVVPEGELLNFAVDKNAEGNGVGTALIKELFKELKHRKFKRVTLEVNEHNAKAVNIYAKNGFKTIGQRENFYNGTENALLMEKFL
ncbi:ribosomal-protein-alanine N-acetyltransferase [Elusimicrobium simillimum]|uniref:ribosomal protein S18-alanine N-acetyltransferase n=1 Tax=Elusimicrobium simillimum TaxID=3143438 RepID=UPI003C6F2E47